MIKKRITYYGAVEGSEEKIYFAHLSKLINECKLSNKNVYFDFNNAHGGSPSYIVNYARTLVVQDEVVANGRLVAIYDYDFKQKDFLKAEDYCKTKPIKNYYSIINFDLWILNHKGLYSKCISKCDDYIKEIKKRYYLEKQDDIKKDEIIKKIVNQISLQDVLNAIGNAKNLKAENKVNLNILDKKHDIYDQPNLQIAEFVEKVLIDCNIISNSNV